MMGAVTYPNPDVERFIQQHFIPVQFNVAEQPEAMEQFNSTWTPTLIVQDAEGREHRRSQGYLDPQRFLAEMSLAWVKDAIDRGDFQAARDRAVETLERTKGDPEREPEAQYWASVAAYKATADPQQLIQGWNRLLDQFPQSEWAKRTEFIRQ
jgi:putative heme degradation protein